MAIEQISLGLDIATSISIIGAAITYIIEQKKQYNDRNERHKIELVQRSVLEIEKLAEEFYLLKEDIIDAALARKSIPMERIRKLFYIANFRVKIVYEGAGSVWFSKEELSILKDLSNAIDRAMKEFMKIVAEESKENPVKVLENLIIDMNQSINNLTSCLKARINEL